MGIGIKRSEVGGSGVGAARRIREAMSLFSDFNKQNQDPSLESHEIGEKEPYLSLKMTDEELLLLSKKWEQRYRSYESKIKDRQERNEKYWLGKQYGWDSGDYRSVDNIVFSSLETLLPIVSRQNPTPFVESSDTRNAENTARIIEKVADEQALKTKIKKVGRHWSIYFIGAFKASWNIETDGIELAYVHPKHLILDPNGNFEGGEFTGKYIGEVKKCDAEDLTKLFPEKKKEIQEMVSNQMGTEVKYTEWWTNDYVFWTLKGLVLDKRQNPHWNYDAEKERTDEFGMKFTESVAGRNHFRTKKKPYSFLSVFNLGLQPHDDTNLVEQAIPLQDMVNKRQRQIDKNADDSNSGWVFNNQFSSEEAKRALKSLRRGGGIIAPTNSIGESVTRLNSPSLPAYVFNDMIDKREQIQNVMGTRGSSAAGIASERTVQGKIEIRQSDADRVSLIVEHLEQAIDYLYNYVVQMVFVYYGPEDFVRMLGEEVGLEYMQFMDDENAPELVVSVKEGSLIPQDPLLRRNEAVDLAVQGLLDPKTMFERMNFPNPEESTKRLIEFQTDPARLLLSEDEMAEMESQEQLPPEQPPINPLTQLLQ
jgi:hypothetical protein